jgi:type I restriction enzyme, S subunit
MKDLKPRPIKDFALGIFDGPHATPAESSDGAIFLGIKNITADGRLDFSDIRHVSEQELPKWTRRVTPQANDVVLTYEATLHRYAIIPDGFRGCLGRRVALVRPDPNKADSRFMLYYFLSRNWRSVVETFVKSGATVDRLLLEQFPDIPVKFPSLPVQKRIAEILVAYDDLIENNRRRIALLEESARLLYREWFVRLRFPGHEHTGIVNGVPEGWKHKTLGDVITLKRGYDLPANDRIDGPIPIVSSSGITGYHADKKCDPPGIVTGRYGTLGQVYLIQEPFWPLNTALYVSDFKETPAAYAALLLEFSLEGTQSDKAAIPGLNRNVAHRLPVLWPPKHLRDEFNGFAFLSYKQSRILTIQNQKIRTARDLLLPKLMSGEIEI